MIRFQWPGSGSKTESPRGAYRFGQIVPVVFVCVWLGFLGFNLYTSFRSGAPAGRYLVGLLQMVPTGLMVLGTGWALRRYVGHLAIAEDGLSIEQASGKRVVPFSAIASFDQPGYMSGIWLVRFVDGSRPVAVLTGEGRAVYIGRTIQSKHDFVDALKARVDEARREEQNG